MFHADYQVIESDPVLGCVVVGYGESQPVMIAGLSRKAKTWYKGPLHLKRSDSDMPYTDRDGHEKMMPVYSEIDH
jgi:hypothetical protein